MLEERIPAPAGINIKKEALITILVCTGISMFFLRTGILSIFYLIPLGYAVLTTGLFMFTFIVAALSNLIHVLGTSFITPENNANMWLDIFYITSLFLLFTWIIGGKNIRTAYRFLLASAAGAIVFLIVINRADSVFFSVFTQMAKIFMPSSDPQELYDAANNILMRGGSFVSILLMFFINRQISIAAASFIKRQKIYSGLSSFAAPLNAIWILIGSLLTVVITNIFKIEALEILSWNVLVISAVIFLVQGIAILMFLLSKRTPGFRIGINILFILVLLSPIGVFAAGALLVLGIIENFRPIRR